MKKLFYALLIMVLLFAFIGCGKKGKKTSDSSMLNTNSDKVLAEESSNSESSNESTDESISSDSESSEDNDKESAEDNESSTEEKESSDDNETDEKSDDNKGDDDSDKEELSSDEKREDENKNDDTKKNDDAKKPEKNNTSTPSPEKQDDKNRVTEPAKPTNKPSGVTNVPRNTVTPIATSTPVPVNTYSPFNPQNTTTPVPTKYIEPVYTPVPQNTQKPTNTTAPTPTSTPVPTHTPKPTSTPVPTHTPIPTNTPAPKYYEIGDIVIMGSYRFTRFCAKEPVEWIVIGKEEDKVLVLSKYILDIRQYGETVFWGDSKLRKDLNSTYYINAMFTKDEQKRIVSVTLTDEEKSYLDEGEYYNLTRRTPVTGDKLFILSETEVKKYLSSPKEMLTTRCDTAAYTLEDGLVQYEIDNKNRLQNGIWIPLRDHRKQSNTALQRLNVIDKNGEICYGAASFGSRTVNHVNHAYYFDIRPAMWIKAEKP